MSNDTSTKHTPGPWRVEWGMHQDGDGHFITCATDQTGLDAVAKVMFHDDHEGETKANALLLHAAPDMLRALREAADVLETASRYFPKSIRNSDTFRLHNVLANSVNPAIAKATGERNA